MEREETIRETEDRRLRGAAGQTAEAASHAAGEPRAQLPEPGRRHGELETDHPGDAGAEHAGRDGHHRRRDRRVVRFSQISPADGDGAVDGERGQLGGGRSVVEAHLHERRAEHRRGQRARVPLRLPRGRAATAEPALRELDHRAVLESTEPVGARRRHEHRHRADDDHAAAGGEPGAETAQEDQRLDVRRQQRAVPGPYDSGERGELH